MTDLKTLKDIDKCCVKCWDKGFAIRIDANKQRLFHYDCLKNLIADDDLRVEAIKWAKAAQKDRFVLAQKKETGFVALALQSEINKIEAQIDFIVHFFNLSEEDLK